MPLGGAAATATPNSGDVTTPQTKDSTRNEEVENEKCCDVMSKKLAEKGLVCFEKEKERKRERERERDREREREKERER